MVLSGICTCLQTSHCPDGIFTCFALMLAGRRCVHRQWHGELLIVHHHWQHSCWSACSTQKFPSPRWENALLTCPIRFSSFMMGAASKTTSMEYVPSAPESSKVPIPDGIFTWFALVLAGRRCEHLQCHSELLIVHHHGQHGSICACSRSKVPIAPMGKLLTCLP